MGKRTAWNKGRKTRVRIECSECHRVQHVIPSYAKKLKTGLCKKCRDSSPRVSDGWFIHPNGYKIICTRTFYREEAEYIRKHLASHSGYRSSGWWFPEHRVVALLHYGHEVVRPGVMIRHLNGDKADNRIENLRPGTAKHNSRDHVSAIADMEAWRAIALALMVAGIAKA